MDSTHDGPYYVVLGGKKAGIYERDRPQGIALGAPKALVPIVVICGNKHDAEAIFALHECIFKITVADDAYTMVYLLQRSPATTIELEVGRPIYAVQVGRETGVYIGYAWKEVRRYVEGAPKDLKTTFEGCETLSQALIAMLKKPGANLPLLPAGVPLPPPSARATRQLRFEIPSLEENPQSPPPSASRAASPVKGAAPVATRSPSPVKSPRALNNPTLPVVPSIEEAADMAELSAAFRQILRADPVEPLRRLLRPPTSMATSLDPNLPAVFFGPEADRLLTGSGIGPAELLTLLQVRVHARTVEAFTHHVGLMLGWSTRDATMLWENMKLPEF